MRTKRVLSILGVFSVAGLLVMVWCGWWFVRAVRSAASGPAITVSKETTFIEGPLDEDGNVDYVAALNALSSDGVTPENNAVVLFWQAFGPGRPMDQASDRFFEMIGMERPPKDGQYLIAEEDYRLKEWLAEPGGAYDKPVESDEDTVSADEIRSQLERAVRSSWSVKECPVVVELLERNEAPLEVVIKGTRQTRYYAPLVATDEQRTLIDMFSPTRNRCCREAAQFLLARAMFRLGEGELDAAWQDLLACHRMARLVAQGPLILDHLCGGYRESQTLSADARVATSGKLTAEQARRFLAELESLGPMPRIGDEVLTCERYSGLGAIADLPTMLRDVMEDEPFMPSGKLGRSISEISSNLALDLDEILRIYNAQCDRVVEAVSKPTRAERIAALEELERELGPVGIVIGGGFTSFLKAAIDEGSSRAALSRQAAESMVGMFRSGIDAGLETEDRISSQSDLTRIAFALAAYHAERGNYPENLTDLSPDYLAEIPTDLFAQSDFRYARNDAGYLLYGVGQNCKDERGRNYGLDYGHLDYEQIPKDAEMGTDDLAIRVPAESP